MKYEIASECPPSLIRRVLNFFADKWASILNLFANKTQIVTKILRKPTNYDLRYKPSQIAKIKKLRKKGKTWDEIGKEMKRTGAGVKSKFYREAK